MCAILEKKILRNDAFSNIPDLQCHDVIYIYKLIYGCVRTKKKLEKQNF